MQTAAAPSTESNESNAVPGMSPSELDRYRAEGLVRASVRLPPPIRQRLRAMADETLAATPDMRPESINCPHLADWIGLPTALSQQWLEIAGLPEILDRVESAIGPDIILWGSQLFCKPAVDGLEVPWHQDGDYWPIEPLATCTVWLAIDDAGVDNGCMRYIPGSHGKRQVFPHVLDDRQDLVLNQVTHPDHFDATSARDDVLEAGEFSVHDVYLIHGSQPNTSRKRRAALVLRFMPATSLYNRETQLESGSHHYKTRFPERPIYLMRGQPGANRDDLLRSHPAHRG